MKARIGAAYNYSDFSFNPIMMRRLAQMVDDEEYEFKYIHAESPDGHKELVTFNIPELRDGQVKWPSGC